MFAAVGGDGNRSVVWGMGTTETAAVQEARAQDGFDGHALTTYQITEEQAAVVEAGDVSWPIVAASAEVR